MDLRKSLFGNIVLSGGSTLTKGFGDRLLHEVQRLAVKDMRIKIFAPPERKYSTWIGGSILAGLSTFRKVCHNSFYSLINCIVRIYVLTKCYLHTDVGQHRRLAREPRNHPHKIQLARYPYCIALYLHLSGNFLTTSGKSHEENIQNLTITQSAFSRFRNVLSTQISILSSILDFLIYPILSRHTHSSPPLPTSPHRN